MNSCGNSNTSTRLRGSKYAETQEESINQGGGISKEESGVISGYSVNDFNVPRNTLVICQRSSNYSSDHGYTRFKPRLLSLLSYGFFIIITAFLSQLVDNNKAKSFPIDSAVYHEMSFEWRVVAAMQTVPGAEHVVGPSKRPSTIATQTQSLAISLHLDPSFKNR